MGGGVPREGNGGIETQRVVIPLTFSMYVVGHMIHIYIYVYIYIVM